MLYRVYIANRFTLLNQLVLNPHPGIQAYNSEFYNMNVKKHLGYCVAKGYETDLIVRYFFSFGVSFKKSDIDNMIASTNGFDNMRSGVDFTGLNYSDVRVEYKAYLDAKESLKKALGSDFIPYMHWS